MALFKSKQIAAGRPAPSALNGSAAVVVVGEFLTVAGLTAADVIEMVAFPAGTVPVNVTVVTEDLDTGATPAITFDVGLLSGSFGDTGTRTCGAEFLSDSNIGQAGGMAQANVAAGLLLGHSTSDRSLGIKIEAAAATLATGMKIRMIATFAPVTAGLGATA